jgi:two-component system, LytTR family, sensor kinase
VLACRHDAAAVEAVTSALSDYLRFCLSRRNKTAPLADELDAVEQLLVVQKARLDEDLHCSVASAPSARRAEVPPLVLAPLVDNALKYAFKTSTAPWKVAITARVAADRLVIEVANSGQWVKPDPARPGLGLANLRRRLQLHGIDHALDFEAESGLVTARLSLPLAPA